MRTPALRSPRLLWRACSDECGAVHVGAAASLTERELKDDGSVTPPAEHPARDARAGRRAVPPRGRSRARAGGARPSRRADRRCATGGAQAEATLAALAPDLALGLTRVAMSRHIGRGDVAAVAHVSTSHRRSRRRRHPRPRRQGRRLCAARHRAAARVRAYTPHGGSLHYGWSSPVGLSLSRARARADTAHRPVPVRERLWPRRLPRQGRRARPPWARRAQRRHRGRVRAGPTDTRTRPISCSSASCACSRASTC